MSIASNFLKSLNAEKLTAEKAPGLFRAIEEIAAQHKITAPNIHLVPRSFQLHPIIDALANKPNAASISRHDIFVNMPILELFESADLNKPISPKLKGVLAHEMHHCANRGTFMAMTRLPILALPVIAVAATYIYDRAHAKAKKQGNTSPQNILGHVDEAVKETHESLPPEVKNSDFSKKLLHFGKYLAVAVIGLGAGLLAVRYGSRYHEFAADIFGAKSVADKEIMIDALRDVHKAAGMSISEHPEAKKFQGIIAETILAHPTFAERAAHIRAKG